MLDVIVCSVQGSRRLLDFLAGGDYDGDRGTVIWAEAFVKSFNNAPERYSKSPPCLDTLFTIDAQTVGQFCDEADKAGLPLESYTEKLQEYLLASLVDPSYVGVYSRMHENAIYEHGYGNSKTVKLAYQSVSISWLPFCSKY